MPSLSLTSRRRLTVLVWLLGFAIAMVAFVRRPAMEIRAIAWAESLVLAATDDGILLELPVSLHEVVSPGEVIARFDPSQLTARSAVLEAELESLQSKASTDQQGRSRRFERDRESAALELAEMAAAADEGQARAKALREKLTIEEQLVAEGVAPNERAADVRRELAVVEARLAADRERLRLARSSARRSGIRAESAEGPNRWQIVMASRRLVELDHKLERLELRSSIAGQISLIYGQPGEWLKAGQPVARLSPMVTKEVHAWIDSPRSTKAAAGMAAEVRRTAGTRLTGTILSVGVERLPIPEELWLMANTPEWGYLARIHLDDGSLAPGEPVKVSIR